MNGESNERKTKREDSKSSKPKVSKISSALEDKRKFLQTIDDLENHLVKFEDFSYNSTMEVVDDLPKLREFFEEGLKLIEELEK